MDEEIQHFMAVTGASLEEARTMMEACAGNLDMAVNMHLECSGNRPGGTTQLHKTGEGSSSDVAASGNPSTYEEIHGVRAPIPQMQGRLIEQEDIAPRRSFRRRNLPKSVFDPFQDFSALSKSGTDAKGKKQTLAELFRPPFSIMFNGTFQEARSAGQHGKKWIMVNLQDSGEFQCQTLNRDLWSNAQVKRIVNKHFVFLQIQKVTDEAVNFCRLYHTNEYPTIAIIDPRTGEKQVEWGHLTVDDFITKVREFLSMNTLNNEMLTSSSSEVIVYEQSEEEQLEAAIKASLEAVDQPTAVILSDTDDDGDDGENLVTSGIKTRGAWAKLDTTMGDLPMETRSRTRQGAVSRRKSARVGNCMDAHGDDETDHAVTNSSNYSSQDESAVMPSKGKRPMARKRRLPARTSKRKRGKMEEDDDELTTESPISSPPCSEALSSTTAGIVGSTSRLTIADGNNQKFGCRNVRVSVRRIENVGGSSSSQQQAGKTGGSSAEEQTHLIIRFPKGDRVEQSFPSNCAIEDLFTFLQSNGLHRECYEVIATFPLRKISSLPTTTTFKEAGLFPRHTLFVQLSD